MFGGERHEERRCCAGIGTTQSSAMSTCRNMSSLAATSGPAATVIWFHGQGEGVVGGVERGGEGFQGTLCTVRQAQTENSPTDPAPGEANDLHTCTGRSSTVHR